MDSHRRQHVVHAPGAGTTYDWSNDRITVKAPGDLTDDRVTLVEDTLKPGFLLPRHHHRRMVEMFVILDGIVRFAFDDETVDAPPGTTIVVPTGVWHEASCAEGGRLITVFTPGGFDRYLAELSVMTPEQLADDALMQRLSESYDSWTR